LSGTGTNQLRTDEEHAIRVVTAHFGGTWRPGEDPPDAYLTVGATEVAVEISTLSQQVPGERGSMIPRYSEDATALWVIRELKNALRSTIPDDRMVLVVMSSPVLAARKVLPQLTKLIQQYIAGSGNVETTIDVLGNQIEIVIKDAGQPDPEKLHGVVSNQKSTPDILLNAQVVLGERISVKAAKCGGLTAKGPVWLVLLNDYFLADATTYQQALAILRVRHPFTKILLVSGTGAVVQLFPA